MSSREKQIEEMAMSIAECNETTCENCALKCSKYTTCEILHDNGYRKMDEVTLKLDLGDRSAEEIQQIAEAFNKEIKKQVAKEIIDSLLSECDSSPYDCVEPNHILYLAKKYGVEIEK